MSSDDERITICSAQEETAMSRVCTIAVICVSAFPFLVGCDSGTGAKPVPASRSGSNSGWLGIPSTVGQVIQMLHDSTGWILNKSQVSVVQIGKVRQIDSESHVAEFRITVTHGGSSFETVAKDVPCDKDGIPTENSVTKLREAVEDIKAKIKRLQN
jgi:hypothetical protein